MNPQYLLFAGDTSTPLGGWHDFIGSYDSVDEALDAVPNTAEWHHIVHENEIIIEDR